MTDHEMCCKLVDALHDRTEALINYQSFYNYIKALCNQVKRNEMTDEGFLKYVMRAQDKFEADDQEYTIKWEVL